MKISCIVFLMFFSSILDCWIDVSFLGIAVSILKYHRNNIRSVIMLRYHVLGSVVVTSGWFIFSFSLFNQRIRETLCQHMHLVQVL